MWIYTRQDRDKSKLSCYFPPFPDSDMREGESPWSQESQDSAISSLESGCSSHNIEVMADVSRAHGLRKSEFILYGWMKDVILQRDPASVTRKAGETGMGGPRMRSLWPCLSWDKECGHQLLSKLAKISHGLATSNPPSILCLVSTT